LSEQLPPAERPDWWSQMWEHYVETQTDYRASLETLARKMTEAGAAAQQVLRWVAQGPDPKWAAGKQAQLLARVFEEQFEVLAAEAAPQPKAKEQLGTERVQNPHDPDATYASKGKGEQRQEHVGYKVQVAETVSGGVLAAGEPTRNFVTGMVTHPARESDEEGALKMEAEQQAMGLDKPSVQYVDAAYISAQKLVEAQAEGRELIGPAPGPAHNNDGRFTSEAYQVTVEKREAICPAGHQNTQCSRLEEQATGRVSYRFEWDTATCAACALRQACIKASHPHRSLVVGEHHTVLQARRQEQKTPSFKERMRHRNAIEGTQSELVRAHGLRRARYRGLAKVKLQNYFIGAACNIKRWLRRLAWELQNASLKANLSGAPATAS
jgi:transposase